MNNTKSITANLSVEPWYTELIKDMCPVLESCIKKGMSKELAIDILEEVSRLALKEAVNVFYMDVTTMDSEYGLKNGNY